MRREREMEEEEEEEAYSSQPRRNALKRLGKMRIKKKLGEEEEMIKIERRQREKRGRGGKGEKTRGGGLAGAKQIGSASSNGRATTREREKRTAAGIRAGRSPCSFSFFSPFSFFLLFLFSSFS